MASLGWPRNWRSWKSKMAKIRDSKHQLKSNPKIRLNEPLRGIFQTNRSNPWMSLSNRDGRGWNSTTVWKSQRGRNSTKKLSNLPVRSWNWDCQRGSKITRSWMARGDSAPWQNRSWSISCKRGLRFMKNLWKFSSIWGNNRTGKLCSKIRPKMGRFSTNQSGHKFSSAHNKWRCRIQIKIKKEMSSKMAKITSSRRPVLKWAIGSSLLSDDPKRSSKISTSKIRGIRLSKSVPKNCNISTSWKWPNPL